MYTIEFSQVFQEIKKRKARKVLLQFPEGLKSQAFQVAQEISETTNVECVLSGDPCYGGCDVDSAFAYTLQIDLILHFGHTPFPGLDPFGIPVVFVPVREQVDVEPVLKKAIPQLPQGGSIGIATTTQYTNVVHSIKNLLENAGFTVKLGTGCGKTPEPTQVLGCEFCNCTQIAEECDMFVFFGTGLFHPLGIALSTRTPVLAVDPVQCKVTPINKLVKKTLAIRVAQMHQFKAARTVGVILGVKLGQMDVVTNSKVVSSLRQRGQRVFSIALREITPSHLLNFPEADAFVITACPRIVIEDGPNFSRPTITPEELEIVFGLREIGSLYPLLSE